MVATPAVESPGCSIGRKKRVRPLASEYAAQSRDVLNAEGTRYTLADPPTGVCVAPRVLTSTPSWMVTGSLCSLANSENASPVAIVRMSCACSFICGSSLFHVSAKPATQNRSEEHTSELQSRLHLVCRLLLEKKKKKK